MPAYGFGEGISAASGLAARPDWKRAVSGGESLNPDLSCKPLHAVVLPLRGGLEG
jgi:hypothetical protein